MADGGGVVGLRLLQRLRLDVDVQVDRGVRQGPQDLDPAALAADHEPEQQPAVHHHLLDVLDARAVLGQHVAEPGEDARVVAPGDRDEGAHPACP